MQQDPSLPSGYETLVIHQPEPSDWQCHLFGWPHGHGLSYRPIKGDEPNWFHRLMQRLILGHVWEKVDASPRS